MEKIKLGDINIKSLEKLSSQGSLGTVYTDGVTCYKLLDKLYFDERRDLYWKFLEMEGLKIDNVILPEDLIMKDGFLYGYTMPYFKDSMMLSDKFLKRYFNCNELFNYVNKASKILRNIHSNGMVCQDLSFENILVNKDGDIAFCDIDGCSYKNNYSPFYSKVFKHFIIDYRNSKVSSLEDIDKVSMILSFYLTLYGELLEKITKRQYNTLSRHIQTLDNLKPCYNMLIDKDCPIENVPYLDETINLSDNYEIDRNKILTFRQKIFRKY